EGLKPMNRQYVHLSSEPAQAQSVGSRHDSQPVVLVIRAGKAAANGVRFYQGEARLFLADAVPPQFIEF
ncbi:MAG: putative 2-phosphotransferase, partial [Abditibacteriota bacterium]|nr:putative 2-phosphotransferase [Abditibacteriota bacterium]